MHLHVLIHDADSVELPILASNSELVAPDGFRGISHREAEAENQPMKALKQMKQTNQLMMVAVAIAAVFSAPQAFAATGFASGYSNKDLLLNFRQQPTGGNAGTLDVTFDLGQVTTFLTTYANSSVLTTGR